MDTMVKSSFSFPGGGFGQNVLIFGADMSSSIHVGSKKRYICSCKRTNIRTRTHINAEKMYPVSFIVTRKVFCLNLRDNGANSYFFC